MKNRVLRLFLVVVWAFCMSPYAAAASRRDVSGLAVGADVELSVDGNLLTVRYALQTTGKNSKYLIILVPAGKETIVLPLESFVGIKLVHPAQDGTISATFPLLSEGDFDVILTGMGQPFKIAKVSKPRVVVPVPQPKFLTYSGETQTGVSESTYYTVLGGSAIDAGTYIAKLTLREPDNFCWDTPGFDGSLEWEIRKTVLPEQLGKLSIYYSDTSRIELLDQEIRRIFAGIPVENAEIVGIHDPLGLLKYSGSGDGLTICLQDGLMRSDIGKKAEISVLLHSRNYEAAKGRVIIEITEKPDLSEHFTFAEPSAVRVYNGAPQRLEEVLLDGVAVPKEHVRFEYSAEPVNAGTYTVTAVYEDAGSCAAANAVLEIRPAMLLPSVEKISENDLVKTYDGTAGATLPKLEFIPSTHIENWTQNAPVPGDYTLKATYVDGNGKESPDAGTEKHLRVEISLGDTEKARNYVLSKEVLDIPDAKILPKYIKPQVSEPADAVFTGKEQTPAVTVYADGEGVLVQERDYTLVYAENLHAGTAQLRVEPVEGSNYYFLDVELPFEIKKAVRKNVVFESELPIGVVGRDAVKTIILSEPLKGLHNVRLGKPSIAPGSSFKMDAAMEGNELTVIYQPPEKRASTLLTVPVYTDDFEPFDLLVMLTAEGTSYAPTFPDWARSVLDNTKFIRESGELFAVGTLGGLSERRGGTKYLSFDAEEIVEALAELEEEAAQRRNAVLRLKIPADGGAMAWELPQKSLRALAAADAQLLLECSAGSALLDAKALSQLARDARGKTVMFRFSSKESDLISFTAESGGESLEGLGKGMLRLFSEAFSTLLDDFELVYISGIEDETQVEMDCGYEAEQGEGVVISNRLGGFQLVRSVGLPLFAPAEGQVSDAQTVDFFDVPEEHWAYRYISALAAEGIVSGVGDGYFAPDKAVTREEFVKLLAGVAGVEPFAYSVPFEDIAPERWSAAEIGWAAGNGYVSGRSNTIFAPAEPITRQEIASILHRYLRLTGQRLPAGESQVLFSDQDKIADWAVEAVSEMQKQGVVCGVVNGSNRWFLPDSSATRAESARMVCVLWDGLRAGLPESVPAAPGEETYIYREQYT